MPVSGRVVPLHRFSCRWAFAMCRSVPMTGSLRRSFNAFDNRSIRGTPAEWPTLPHHDITEADRIPCTSRRTRASEWLVAGRGDTDLPGYVGPERRFPGARRGQRSGEGDGRLDHLEAGVFAGGLRQTMTASPSRLVLFGEPDISIRTRAVFVRRERVPCRSARFRRRRA